MTGELQIDSNSTLVTDEIFEIDRYRILLLEDDPESRQATLDILSREKSIQTDVASSIAEASAKLKQHVYDVIVADVALDQQIGGKQQSTSPQGDEFLLSNLGSLENTDLVILTAEPLWIKDRASIDASAITVIKKADPDELEFLSKLVDDAPKIRDRRIQILQQDVQRALDQARNRAQSAIPPDILQGIQHELEQMFLDWLHGRTNKDAKIMHVDSQERSINDLISEVATNTETGQKLIRLFVRAVGVKLGFRKIEKLER